MEAENKIQGRWERVKGLFDIGVKLVIASGVLTFSKDRLISAFTEEGLAKFPVVQLYVILLLETIYLIFLWIKAVSDEMQMLKDNIGEFIPGLPKPSLNITVGLALLLGALGYFSNRIEIYCGIFVVIKIFEIWGLWVRDSHLRIALELARKGIAEGKERLYNLRAIEDYYLNRPQLPLAVTVIFFSFLSLILGVLGKLSPIENTREICTVGAYIVIIVVIAFNEVVYITWRRKRDSNIS